MNAQQLRQLRDSSKLFEVIDWPTNPANRNPDAQNMTRQWADGYVEGIQYAQRVQALVYRIDPAFIISKEVLSSARVLHMSALLAYLEQKIMAAARRCADELNQRFDGLVSYTVEGLMAKTGVRHELDMLTRFKQSIRFYHLAAADDRTGMKLAIERDDLQAFHRHLPMARHIDDSKKYMLAIKRYFELPPELVEEHREMLFERREETLDDNVIAYHRFLVTHVLFLERIKAVFDNVKTEAVAAAAQAFKYKLEWEFIRKLVVRDYNPQKPVKISLQTGDIGAQVAIQRLVDVLDLSHLVMGEASPESHLTEFLANEAPQTYKGRNGQAVSVYQTHVKTTVEASTADKLIALSEVPMADLATMIEGVMTDNG